MDNLYYINGIKQNNNKVLREIYTSFSKPIVNHVLKNSGSLSDAQDVFQDGLIIIYKKIRDDKLELTASFGTYLFSICRFVWLKKLKKTYKKEVTLEDAPELMDDKDIEVQYIEMEKQSLFDRSLAKLPKECQKILQMYFDKKKGTEIADDMEYTIEYVKRKKYKCKKKLIQIVKEDHNYGDLANSWNEGIK